MLRLALFHLHCFSLLFGSRAFLAVSTMSLASRSSSGFLHQQFATQHKAVPCPDDLEKARFAIMDFDSYKKEQDLLKTVQVITATFDCHQGTTPTITGQQPQLLGNEQQDHPRVLGEVEQEDLLVSC